MPFAAMQDAKLYELLARFDALRVGKARERGMALERLQALIDPSPPSCSECAAATCVGAVPPEAVHAELVEAPGKASTGSARTVVLAAAALAVEPDAAWARPPTQLWICAHNLSSRFTLTGCGVRSSCAKKLTRSSSSSQRSSCMRASTWPLRSATSRQ